ncbi:Gfo/Idh/MocA family protein [Emticicia sp. 21SJ11W-3]|uniref:Gfo/Idh/MocA family protein n=1 Tax=Emticicia sp. 21SJ11W-3 TaxID=2916755 RepID=UPI00209F882B|nr:Gfo/Idh/MocA family oxidoreductase [Emticicia sp. 21SJ11W-3]UTA68151.1 Gfo/Idh/MocA family oxidoreductase [Emticicia sp. 21SJ11W-3]
MAKTIRWGIIGIGKIAEKFAADLVNVPDTELYAVASTSSERAENFAKQFNVPHFYSSYEEIFNAPGLDVVYIATPHTAHASAAILCLNNKIPVLCEKPFAMNLKEVQQMVEAARANDTFLMEAMWTRFIPAIEKTLELIAEDRIGKVKTIQADFGFVAPHIPERRVLNPALGGGALLDIGIYPAYLALLILGYPTDVQAFTIAGKTGVDETTSFVFRYPQATAMLNATYATRTRTEALIYGEKGYIHLPERFHETKTLTLFETDNEPVTFSFDRETRGYNYEIEEVNNCVRHNKKESVKMPLSMSVKLISLLDDIRQKAGIFYEGIDG